MHVRHALAAATFVFCSLAGAAAKAEVGDVDALVLPVVDVTASRNAPVPAPAMPAMEAEESGQNQAMERLTIELEKVGLGTGRIGRPGVLRNRANEEGAPHCPDNKCIAEDLVGGELYKDFATVAFVASRTLMSTGLVVWLVSARSGSDRQTSLGPRLGGISLQGTF